MVVALFANGDMDATAWARAYLAEVRAIVAADGGVRHLLALDLRPDVVIGDLDSFPPAQREGLAAAGTRFIEHPAAKDETDLELALLYAVARYDEPILIFGGLGGRLDQLFANVLLLMHPHLRGASIRFVTEHQQLWLVQAETAIVGEAGDTVSLIPLGANVEVAATTGLLWPLRDETLSFGPARGLSNVMLEERATVSVKAGALLCVHTKKVWKR
jgi:thiamine pyrophosphokinase